MLCYKNGEAEQRPPDTSIYNIPPQRITPENLVGFRARYSKLTISTDSTAQIPMHGNWRRSEDYKPPGPQSFLR
jgi:hypothetical protein